MKKSSIIISSEECDGIRLRSICERDLEELREWKNVHRSSFFYQEIISSKQQLQWYQNYKERRDDIIFMLEDTRNGLETFGCLGARLKNESIDLYNVIRGRQLRQLTSMKKAMMILLNYLQEQYSLEIKCDVLKNNPAVIWYKKCGFVICEEKEYYVMNISKESIEKLPLTIQEIEC